MKHNQVSHVEKIAVINSKMIGLPVLSHIIFCGGYVLFQSYKNNSSSV